MTDQVKFDPLQYVSSCAVFFKRDSEISLPSGDEVRQLMEKGLKWRWVLAGYLRAPDGDTLSAFAVSNELKPADDWEEKAYRGVIVQMANAYMKRLIEMQAAARAEEAEKAKGVVTP